MGTRVGTRVTTSTGVGVKLRVGAWEVDAKELLLLVGAFGGLSKSVLSTGFGGF